MTFFPQPQNTTISQLTLLPLCLAPLEYASLRGPHVLLDSPLPSLPVQCSVTYNAGPFQGQGTIWNLSCTGWRLSGDLPMRPGETLSLTVTLPNEQRIEIPEAVVRWSRGSEFAVETIKIDEHTVARLQHYVRCLVQYPVPILQEELWEKHDSLGRPKVRKKDVRF